MNKQLLEMLDAIDAKKQEVVDLTTADKIDEATKAKEELVRLQEKFDLLKDVVKDDAEPVSPKPVDAKPVAPLGNKKDDAIKAFADAARRGFKVDMSEGVGEDGGYTVPEDIQTTINILREAKASLTDYVRVEPVTTKSGSRVFKSRTQLTGFKKVGENTAIGKKDGPKFTKVDYDIAKYAGYLPVTNELLADSDQAITNTITEWIADESRVTRNNLILDVVKAHEKTAITDLDGIKQILNVKLGAAFKPTSAIYTNDDGFNWLDTLKDDNGRYLLVPVPNQPGAVQLNIGGVVVPVINIPNADMPSDTKTTAGSTIIPFIIGDLTEGIIFFDRQQYSVLASDVASAGGVSSFENDLTMFRAIEREDVKERDAAAYAYATLTLKN